MKRIIFSITVSLALAMVLTACGGSGSGTGGSEIGSGNGGSGTGGSGTGSGNGGSGTGGSGTGNGGTGGSSPANTFYVKSGNNAQNADGRSWDKAYADLSKALKAVHDLNTSKPGTITEIWIAKGTEPYKPTRNGLTDADTSKPREVYFTLLDNVKIYGGFEGKENKVEERKRATDGKLVNTVILSGDIGTPNDATDNAYHVVSTANLKNTAQLHGVTITGGNANGSSPHYRGGGVYIGSGNPTLTNVTISSNTSKNNGGGIYIGGGSPTLANVTISGNTSEEEGGGVFVYNADNPTLTNVTISGNTSKGNGGGGASLYGVKKPTLTNVTISDNKTTGSEGKGGGISIGRGGNPTLTNVTISSNTSKNNGGGIYIDRNNLILINGTISNNTSETNGGGVYVVGGSPTFANVTITDNTTKFSGGGIEAQHTLGDNGALNMNIINTIIWGNKVGTTPSPTAAKAGVNIDQPFGKGTINMAYSIVQNAQLGNSDTEVQDKGNSNAKIGDSRGGNKFDDPALAAALANNGGSVQTIKLKMKDDPSGTTADSPAAGAGAYVKACNTSSYCFNTNANATGNWNNITGGTATPTGDALNQTDARGFDVKSTFTVPSGKTKVAIGAYNPYATAP